MSIIHMYLCKKTLLISTLFAVVPAVANASLVLKLVDSDANTVTVIDEGLGDSTSGNVGTVSFNGGLGGNSFNLAVGSSKPDSGSATQPALKLTYFATSIIKDMKMTISLTDTDFTGPINQWPFLSSISKTDSSSNSYKLYTYLDSLNVGFGTATPIALGLTPSGGVSAGVDVWSDVSASANYSLTMVVELDLKAGTIAQFNSLLEVPEPSMLSLLGLVMLGFVGMRWRFT